MIMTLEMPDTLVETVIKDIMGNFPEASEGSSLRCTDWRYPDDKPLAEWRFEFEDTEEPSAEHPDGKLYCLDGARLLAAFPLIFTDKWPRGCPRPPMVWTEKGWDDWVCDCDAEAFDAFAQLACFGSVIYG